MPNRMKVFVYAVIAVVAAAIIAGFVAVGSPQTKRLHDFDNRRVSDMQFLQNEIITYWQVKQKLPQNLASLNDSTRGIVVPKDPQTATDYEYTTKAPLVFTLCAKFLLPSTESGKQATPAPYYMVGPGMADWSHGAGRACFDRTIDTDFNPPIKPAPKNIN